MKNLYDLMVREGVLKNMKRTLLEVPVAAAVLIIALRYSKPESSLQWDVLLDEMLFVALLSLGVTLARAIIELVFILSGGSIVKKPIVQ
ncbi:MAG: hypothetical protein WCV89_00840 [Candidatus Paceibacterota bacterium]|jgi:hypothetical protein